MSRVRRVLPSWRVLGSEGGTEGNLRLGREACRGAITSSVFAVEDKSR